MSDDWYSIRRQVFERDHYACKRCGKLEKECHRSLDVPHIIPAGKGGLDELDNLIALCPVCHPAEKSKSRPRIQMVERTFHIPIDIDDKLTMMAVRDHLRFSEIATLAIREHISRVKEKMAPFLSLFHKSLHHDSEFICGVPML